MLLLLGALYDCACWLPPYQRVLDSAWLKGFRASARTEVTGISSGSGQRVLSTRSLYMPFALPDLESACDPYCISAADTTDKVCTYRSFTFENHNKSASNREL